MLERLEDPSSRGMRIERSVRLAAGSQSDKVFVDPCIDQPEIGARQTKRSVVPPNRVVGRRVVGSGSGGWMSSFPATAATALRDVSERREIIGLASALYLLVPGLDLEAQQLKVSSNVACSSCTAELIHVATLGSDDGPGALAGPPAVVRRDSRGNFFVVQYIVGAEITVFDSTGTFVRVLGGKGSGPGEFRSIRGLAVGPGDSLYVFDNGNHRQTVLAPDWTVARTAPLGSVSFVHAAERLADGTIVLNASVATAEGIGLPLHVLHPSGAIGRSFGAALAAARPDMPWLQLRAMAPASERAVWIAPRTSYLMEKWDTGERLLSRIERDADWFRPYLTRPVGTNEPPDPLADGSPAVEWQPIGRLDIGCRGRLQGDSRGA